MGTLVSNHSKLSWLCIKTEILRKFNANWGAFIRENDLQSLFPLSRSTENSNRANSLEALSGSFWADNQ